MIFHALGTPFLFDCILNLPSIPVSYPSQVLKKNRCLSPRIARLSPTHPREPTSPGKFPTLEVSRKKTPGKPGNEDIIYMKNRWKYAFHIIWPELFGSLLRYFPFFCWFQWFGKSFRLHGLKVLFEVLSTFSCNVANDQRPQWRWRR